PDFSCTTSCFHSAWLIIPSLWIRQAFSANSKTSVRPSMQRLPRSKEPADKMEDAAHLPASERPPGRSADSPQQPGREFPRRPRQDGPKLRKQAETRYKTRAELLMVRAGME